MESFWTDIAQISVFWSYISLFTLAFLSASLLPMGSVWFLLILLARGDDPIWLWIIASAGNTLGGVLNYWLGFYASQWVRKRQDPVCWKKAEHWYERYGVWSLMLSWLPIIGDPLTLVAGVLRANFWLFVVLVGVGKAARYAVVIFGFDYVAN